MAYSHISIGQDAAATAPVIRKIENNAGVALKRADTGLKAR